MLQCPRCKSNRVTNVNDDLLCLSCGNRETLEDYPIATSIPYFPGEDKRIEELVKKINDLEAISAQPGSVPRYYHERTQQLQGKVNYLQNNLNEHIDKLSKLKKQKTQLKDIEI